MPPPREYFSVEQAALSDRPLHLAIGMFDGVHVGHRAVIEAAVGAAHRGGGHSAVLTFRPHPSRLFRPDQPTRLIFDTPSQADRLGRLGVEALIIHPFTREFAALPAEQFLPWLRQRLPSLTGVYVGENWRFGAGRKGDIGTLAAAGRAAGISIFSAPPVYRQGGPVTSTRIRSLLEQGEIGPANALLGCPYASTGVVAAGKRLGRTLGFPTLNVPWEPELQPRHGVYQVRVGEGCRLGVANYGLRPTLERARHPLLEIHLLADCPYGEGDTVRAEWIRFIRPELKFPSLADLQTQIGRDIAAAREG